MKHSIKLIAVLLTLWIGVNQHAMAERIPQDSRSADSRIKTLIYSEKEVFRIHGHYYYQSVIEFADDERVTTISSGRPEAWEIVPIERYVMLRPIEEESKTNVTIVTTKRIYHFLLDAHDNQNDQAHDLNFKLVFRYPKDEFLQVQQQEAARREQAKAEEAKAQSIYTVPPRAIDPSDLNFDYRASGDKTLIPSNVFDDGEFTYFEFSPAQPLPSIYLVEADRQERLVNLVKKGQYMVVKTTGQQFSLRKGRFLTCIFNQSKRIQ